MQRNRFFIRNGLCLVFTCLVLLGLSIPAATDAVAPAAAPTAAADTKGPIGHLTNIGTNMGFADGQGNASQSLATTMGTIIKTIISISGSIMMAYIIFAGWLWMTAHGEEEKISKAKSIIRGSVVGLIIIFSAYIITATVVDRFSRSTGYTTTPGAAATTLQAPIK
jgi:hypothetical protein